MLVRDVIILGIAYNNKLSRGCQFNEWKFVDSPDLMHFIYFAWRITF